MVATYDGAELGNLVCEGCGEAQFHGGDMVADDKKQFACVACGLLAFLPAQTPLLPCPYCGARCIKLGYGKGKNKTRPRRYYCTTCKHTNCDLYPAERLENLNGYCYRAGFNLDLGAKVGLNDFCQQFRMRETEGVRAVFRASRFATLELPPRSGFAARAAAREGAVYAEPARSAEAIAASAPIGDVQAEVKRLPDVRSQVSRARMAGRAVWEACHDRPVDVVQFVSVALDATAMAGLIRAMTFLDTDNRQVAGRFLLTNALSRFGAFVVVPPLRGVKPGRFT